MLQTYQRQLRAKRGDPSFQAANSGGVELAGVTVVVAPHKTFDPSSPLRCVNKPACGTKALRQPSRAPSPQMKPDARIVLSHDSAAALDISVPFARDPLTLVPVEGWWPLVGR